MSSVLCSDNKKLLSRATTLFLHVGIDLWKAINISKER